MRIHTEIERKKHRNLWVIGERRHGRIPNVTLELLGAGRRLADRRGQQLWCTLLGHRLTDAADICFAHGADTVLAVDAPELSEFVEATYATILSRVIERYRPEIVLAGATAYGRSLIPRVAARVETGLTADCTGLEIEENSGLLLQTRPAFGGNLMATIKCGNHLPQMATVRPGVIELPQPDQKRRGRLISEPFLPADQSELMRVLRTVVDQSEVASMADAHIIVSGGRGIKGRAGFELLHEFARFLGGAVGASRAAVDAGWIDYAHQIGQTGQTVQPRVYIACGISGQIQHLVGMQSADLIVAINSDSRAPIMQVADYAITADLFEFVPAFIEAASKT